jgi:hypothetical protein
MAEGKMPSHIQSESAQDAEHHVVRDSRSTQDAVVRASSKSETSRANGAKSRGPVTPAGRAVSSRNSLRHGLTAKSVVLPTESAEQWQSLLDAYLDHFDPQTGVERDLVETMAAARWRLRRISTIETVALYTEMVRREEDIDKEFSTADSEDRLAWVFQKLADEGKTLALLVRYEATLTRSYDRAFKQLLLLQSTRHRPQPNQPKPAPLGADAPASPGHRTGVPSGPASKRPFSPPATPSAPSPEMDPPEIDPHRSPGATW